MTEGKMTPEQYEEVFGDRPPGFERVAESMIVNGKVEHKFEPGRYPLSPIPVEPKFAIQRITGVLYRTNDIFRAKDILFDNERWYPISVNFDDQLQPIGRARVFHRSLGELTVEGELYQLAPTYPKLAARISATEMPGIGRLLGIGVCHENMTHSIPPYQLFPVEAK